MPEFDSINSPEVLEWARSLGRGIIAEEDPLLRLLSRMEEEADEQGILQALFRLFSHYCRHHSRAQALDILERIRATISPLELAGTVPLIADKLWTELGEADLAHQFIDSAIETLGIDQSVGIRCSIGMKAYSLKLQLQLHQGASSEQLEETLINLETLAEGAYFSDEGFVTAVRSMRGMPAFREHALSVLDVLWANLKRETDLYERGNPSIIRELEELRSAILDLSQE